MSAITDSIRAPWAIAVYTWREGMRKKTLIGFFVLCILVIFGSNVMTSFMTELPETSIATDVEARLIKDICITTISIFGVLITIFISASVVPTEVENKVVYTVLSKPVRRFHYLLGKFVGVQLVVLVNLLLMGALFFVAIYFKQQVLPTLLIWAVFLTYLEFLVVSALTFAVAATSSSSVLPTISGLFIYIVGNLTTYLEGVADRAKLAAQGTGGFSAENIIANIAYVLQLILPNLQNFSIRNQIVHAQPNDPPQDIYIWYLLLYTFMWVASGFLISYWVFRRKEL